MDAITLATITSGVTVLAAEAGKGLAGEAGKDVWARIKSVLGWKSEPKAEELAPAVAQRLAEDDDIARRVVELLREHAAQSMSAAIVGNISINAEKVTVIRDQTIAGDFNLSM